MHSIKIDKRRYQLPSGWEELTKDQVRKVAVVHGNGFERNLQALFLLSSRRLKNDLARIDPAKVSAIADCLEWLNDKRDLDDPTDEVFPLVKSFRHKGTVYHFPQESLNDVMVGEWSWADHYITQIGENPHNPAPHLHGLLATVCRPLRPKKERTAKDYDGYPRQYFNPELIPYFEKKLKGVQPWVYFVLDDYVGRCQKMLKARYEPVFSGPKSDGPNWGWNGIVMNVAETGIYGPEKSVNRENIHNLCLYLSKKILDDRAFKQELENIRKKNARS